MSIFKTWATFDACPEHNDVQFSTCPSKWSTSYTYNNSAPLSTSSKEDLQKSIAKLVDMAKSESDKIKEEMAFIEEALQFVLDTEATI